MIKLTYSNDPADFKAYVSSCLQANERRLAPLSESPPSDEQRAALRKRLDKFVEDSDQD